MIDIHCLTLKRRAKLKARSGACGLLDLLRYFQHFCRNTNVSKFALSLRCLHSSYLIKKRNKCGKSYEEYKDFKLKL